MKIETAIKQPIFSDPYHKMLVNLIFTGNWLRDEQIKILRPFDILPQHYNVLRIIRGRRPKTISPGEIKEVLIDKANDLTRLLDKLEKKGYINRLLCPSNRRKMDISITEKGLQLLKDIQIPMESFTKCIQERLNDTQATKLSNLLDLLRE